MMNTATAVALLVSILGFFTIVAIAFLCHKLKATKSILIPPSPIQDHLNISSLSLPSSFLLRPTNYVTIRHGQVVPRSQASTPSIRSGLSWHRLSRLQSSLSFQSSQHDLRSVASRDRLRATAARDLEKGAFNDASPIDRSLTTTPTLSRHASRLHQHLPAVPEMAQASPPRGVPSHEQLMALGARTSTPRIATPPSYYELPNSSFTAPVQRTQQYHLPNPPMRTKSTTFYHEDVNNYTDAPTSPTRTKPSPRVRTYELGSTPSSPTALSTPLRSRFNTYNDDLPATPDSKAVLAIFSPEDSPFSPQTDVAGMTTKTQTPSSSAGMTLSHSGTDEAALKLLKSKYNLAGSWI